MADQAVITGPSINQAIGNRDVCVSIIIPKNNLTPEEYQQIKRLLRDKLELKLVPGENIKIAMNEKIAGIAFPDLKGKMDFNSGFTSGSIDFHKWCGGLFSFYSNRLKKPF
jgi:predicted transcriptional regulator